MAFGKAKESTEGASFKRYIGIASVYVKGVNPTKEELEKFYEREVPNTPEYVSTADLDGEKVQQVRIDVLVEVDPVKYKDNEGNPIQLKNKIAFFLRNRYRYNKEKTKVQVIDTFGTTGWATKEELTNNTPLKSAEGKNLRITTPYRPAYEGEPELIDFLKTFLGIDDYMVYANGNWIPDSTKNAEDCKAGLENVNQLFAGNVKEVKDAFALMPNNRVKVMFGVRTADDGKQYQTIFTRKFMRNSASNYSGFDKELNRAKEFGAFSTTEFATTELMEYNPAPTEFSTEETKSPDLPW